MKMVLIEKKLIAKDTLFLSFKPDKKIDYIAGDFIYLPVDLKHADKRGNIRQFSLSSSPTEKYLETATRLRSKSGYKKSLNQVQIGDTFEIDPPIGTLHLQDTDQSPHVFIAGGVGIVPFRSRIKYILDKKLDIPIHLIYSNHTKEDVCFYDELNLWPQKSNILKVDHVFSKKEGRLNYEKLSKLLSGSTAKKYWVTGSPEFVDTIESLLLQLKISQENIITEKFTGY